jgi:phosphate:Na+ symporter
MGPSEDILLKMIGGICLLLWGVHMVNAGLNEAFGSSLRRLISNYTSNRVKAFFVGLGIATILQSSTAASLIVSAFAARKVITITAALGVMLGADVGTTIAAQLMSLNLTWLIWTMIILGFVVNSAMKESLYRHVGRAFVGMGLALLSLHLITEAAEPLKQSEVMHALIGPLSEQPMLAVIISMLLTWFSHSSLGTILLYVGFVKAGTIPVNLGLFMVLGANIGGVLAPVVMTLRDMPSGRRVALGNLLTRTIGVIFIMPFMNTMVLPLITQLHPDPARILVNFHMLFNIALAIIFLPFIGPLTRLSEIILPDRPREEDEALPRYLDPGAIDTPTIALACVARETLRLSDFVQKMLLDTLEALRINNPRLVKEIRDQESNTDGLYEAIKVYLSRLPVAKLDVKENRRYMEILTFSTNLEHIGDIIDKSLMELAMKKIKNQDSFSRQGFSEISDLHTRVMESMTLAQNVFMTGDVKMARKLFEEKAQLRSYEMLASESHFKRLSDGVAETIATSSLHLDILRDLRRVNSYITLIAYPILEEANELNPSLLKPPRKEKVRKPKVKTPKEPPAATPLPEKY